MFFSERIATWPINRNSSLDRIIFPFKTKLLTTSCRLRISEAYLTVLHEAALAMGQGSTPLLAFLDRYVSRAKRWGAGL